VCGVCMCVCVCVCVCARVGGVHNTGQTEHLLCFIAVSDIYINQPSELMTLALLLLESDFICPLTN